jgi:hypothetical protein
MPIATKIPVALNAWSLTVLPNVQKIKIAPLIRSAWAVNAHPSRVAKAMPIV